MSQRSQLASALLLGIALGAGATWLSIGFAKRGAEGPQIVTTAVTRAGDAAGSAAEGSDLEWIPPPAAPPRGSEGTPRDLEGEAGGEPEAAPPPVDYPLLEKLTSRSLSEVPHAVLGAWDEDRAGASPGLRRAFVLVVEPGLSEGELAALARDVRDQNRDAVILDVRIYDSERAALQPRAVDGGNLAFQHLVAEVKKNDRIPLDVIRVHGRVLE